MNERQAFALANPISDTNDFSAWEKLSTIHPLPDGNTICILLAIDR
jgi:hypothetical protein